MLVLASLVLGFPTLDALASYDYMFTSDAYEALFGCEHLGCIAMMPVALSIPSPFLLHVMICLPCLFVPPVGFICIFTLAYMSMHESCLLVCCPCFNTMKLWTFDPNLHLSLADTTFCLFSCLFTFCLFVCYLAVCLLTCLLASWFLCLPCLLCLSALFLFMRTLHIFLPLLVYWFLVCAFACTHTE